MINIIRALGLLVLNLAVVVLIGGMAILLGLLAAVMLRAAKLALNDCRKQCGDVCGESCKLARQGWDWVCCKATQVRSWAVRTARYVWVEMKTLPSVLYWAARNALRVLAEELFIWTGRKTGKWVARRAFCVV